MTQPTLRTILLLAAVFTLGACSTMPDDTIEPADVLYREARANLDAGNYPRAQMQLQEIMSRYPFTDFAVQAHLDVLFVLVQQDQPDAASEEAERFIRENPRHPDIDYAYYMQGLAFYPGLTNPLRELADMDMAKQDVENAKTSFDNFARLISRFPDSKYAADARLRMVELKERIARHEIHVADYYLRRGAWISALQTAYRVLRTMQGTAAEIDALMVMERAYEGLGLEDLAETPRRILAENPDREPAVLKRD